MGNGKITKELKGLGLKINKTEPNGETVSEVIKGIVDDYEGGTGKSKYYRHYLTITFGDGSDIMQFIGIIENTSPNAITISNENDLMALMTKNPFNLETKILNGFYGNGVMTIPTYLLYNTSTGWMYASGNSMALISYAFSDVEETLIVEL